MRKYLYWLFPFMWMIVIFISSSQPYEKQNIQPFLTDTIELSFLEPYIHWISITYNQSEVSVERLGVYGFIEFFIRKGAHVFVFLTLCCLFLDRKSTRLNSSHVAISYAVFCLKKKQITCTVHIKASISKT